MFRNRRHLVSAFFLLCSAVVARGETRPAHVVDLPHLDALYERRGEPHALDELIATAKHQRAANPESYDVTWRLARAWSWRGFTSEDDTERRRAAEKALKLGRKAMALEPNRVEGYFTYAIAAGVYANAIGVAEAFVRRVSVDFEQAMTRACEIDRHFDDGSPLVALGRYYYELPWPLRDLEKSAQLLEEATRAHPDSTRGHLYLAETYHALRRRREARRELTAVLHTNSTDAGASALVRTANLRMHEWYGQAVRISSDPSGGSVESD